MAFEEKVRGQVFELKGKGDGGVTRVNKERLWNLEQEKMLLWQSALTQPPLPSSEPPFTEPRRTS
jgi:hypothetical protein